MGKELPPWCQHRPTGSFGALNQTRRIHTEWEE